MSSKCKLAMARSLAGLDCTLQSCASAPGENGISSPKWIWHHKNKSNRKQDFVQRALSLPVDSKLSGYLDPKARNEVSSNKWWSKLREPKRIRCSCARYEQPLFAVLEQAQSFAISNCSARTKSLISGSESFSCTATLYLRVPHTVSSCIFCNFHWFTYLGGFAIPWRTWSLANHHQGLQLPLLQWLLALQGCPYCRRPIQIGHALQVWKVTLINYKWFQLSRKIWSSWTISPSQGKQ